MQRIGTMEVMMEIRFVVRDEDGRHRLREQYRATRTYLPADEGRKYTLHQTDECRTLNRETAEQAAIIVSATKALREAKDALRQNGIRFE